MSTSNSESILYVAIKEDLLAPFEAEVRLAERECGITVGNALSITRSNIQSADLNFDPLSIGAAAVVVLAWSAQVVAAELLIVVLTKALTALRHNCPAKPRQVLTVIVDEQLCRIEILAEDDDASIAKKIRSICREGK